MICHLIASLQDGFHDGRVEGFLVGAVLGPDLVLGFSLDLNDNTNLLLSSTPEEEIMCRNDNSYHDSIMRLKTKLKTKRVRREECTVTSANSFLGLG